MLIFEKKIKTLLGTALWWLRKDGVGHTKGIYRIGGIVVPWGWAGKMS